MICLVFSLFSEIVLYVVVDFAVFMGGGELMIFLLCYIDPTRSTVVYILMPTFLYQNQECTVHYGDFSSFLCIP